MPDSISEIQNTSNIQIKVFNHEGNEKESTLSFLKSVVTHEMNEEIWKWEFESSTEECVMTIIKDKNETVATQFMLPIPLNINELVLLSGKCENSYMNSPYRGKGLFEELFTVATNRAVNNSMKILWAFTPAIKVYGAKFGYTVYPEIIHRFSAFCSKPKMRMFEIYSKNIPKNYVKYIYYFLKFILLRQKLKISTYRLKTTRIVDKFVIKNSPDNWKEIDDLYSKVRSIYKNMIHININKDYFEWRITKNVNVNYSTKYFYLNGELAGYYILSSKDNIGFISDFTYVNDECSKIMINSLMKEAVDNKFDYVHYFGNPVNPLNNKTFKILEYFGGNLSVDTGMPFVFKRVSKIDTDTTFLDDPANWYLNGLWTEGFTF